MWLIRDAVCANLSHMFILYYRLYTKINWTLSAWENSVVKFSKESINITVFRVFAHIPIIVVAEFTHKLIWGFSVRLFDLLTMSVAFFIVIIVLVKVFTSFFIIFVFVLCIFIFVTASIIIISWVTLTQYLVKVGKSCHYFFHLNIITAILVVTLFIFLGSTASKSFVVILVWFLKLIINKWFPWLTCYFKVIIEYWVFLFISFCIFLVCSLNHLIRNLDN